MVASANSVGKITQVIGSTLDAEFSEAALPKLYNALKVRVQRSTGTETIDETLTCEVASHLGGGRVRAPAPWGRQDRTPRPALVPRARRKS